MTVSPCLIVEGLDVIEHIRSGQLACSVNASANALLLQAAEKRLGDRVIPAIVATAHAGVRMADSTESMLVVAAMLRFFVRKLTAMICAGQMLMPGGHVESCVIVGSQPKRCRQL